MLKRILAKFRVTPSTAVSPLALVGAFGGARWAANGGAFILGVFNSATQRTALVANYNGSALQVANTSTAASAVPLQLIAAAGHPPMKVNTVTKVTNLNAAWRGECAHFGTVRPACPARWRQRVTSGRGTSFAIA